MLRSRRRPAAVTRHAAGLALAAPQVIALRAARMLQSGPVPDARDRREFARMVAEKPAAFAEAWMAMVTRAVLAQQAFAWSCAAMAWSPWNWPSLARRLRRQRDGALADVLGQGLRPLHRTARANARRLRRAR